MSSAAFINNKTNLSKTRYLAIWLEIFETIYLLAKKKKDCSCYP